MASSDPAPFSFHCVICIEAFNFHDRQPVVLPCGHTYICESCSKRIDKCMECRTSLFVKKVPNISTDLTLSSTHSNSSSMDYGYHNQYPQYPTAPGTPVSRRQIQQIQKLAARYGSSPPPAPKRAVESQQVALPLPRNIVLLELMDAATKQHKDSRYGGIDTEDDEADEEDVLNSIGVLASSCGTYSVSERSGLAVYSIDTADAPFHDEGMDIDLYLSTNSNDSGSVSSGKVGRWNGKSRGRKVEGRGSILTHVPQSKPTTMLSFGQKVQIVDVLNGVYRLARNTGVIFAKPSQLVKVGTAQDESCKVEGMIRAIVNRKADLSQKMDNLISSEANLQSNLDHLLSLPESHSIISEPPREQPIYHHHNRQEENKRLSSDRCISSTYSSSSDCHSHHDAHYFPTTFIGDDSIGPSTPTPATPPTLTSPRSRKIFFDDTPFSTTSGRSENGTVIASDDGDVDGSPFRSGLMCGVQSTLIPLFRKIDDDGDDFRSRIPIRRSDSDDTSTRNSNFESVDFRTGFSGHIGMNQARKSRRAFQSHSQVRMMGEHRGIARIRTMREKPGYPSSPVSDKKK